MALTKVTGQVINDTTGLVVGVTTVGGGISATDGFFSGIVTAVGNASFSGNVSVGGTLTYEDVTNIDAVGLVTARNGIVVGSGITLSKDGDVFFTGIATGNGSGLTALNASNLASGTVPTARLGSGTASSSTFLRGDSSFQTVNTDLVSDTSPQLGGDLQSNSHDIKIADASGYDGNNIYMGSDNDMRIHHDGSNFEMSNSTGTIYLRTDSAIHIQKRDGSTKIAEFNADADCELYHNGTKQCETSANGLAFPAGKGIDFSAQTHGTAASGVTVNSELLDHYEEGSFQPLLKRLMTNGTTETNFYDQGTKQGYYQIIGNRIYLTARIHWSGGSTGTGSLILTNLPYTPTSGGANEVPMYIGFRSGFNYTNVAGYLVQSMNRFMVQYYDANGSYAIAPSATDSSGHFYFAMNYQI